MALGTPSARVPSDSFCNKARAEAAAPEGWGCVSAPQDDVLCLACPVRGVGRGGTQGCVVGARVPSGVTTLGGKAWRGG